MTRSYRSLTQSRYSRRRPEVKKLRSLPLPSPPLQPPPTLRHQTIDPTPESHKQKYPLRLVCFLFGFFLLFLFFFSLAYLMFQFFSFYFYFFYGGWFYYWLLGVVYLLLLISCIVVDDVNLEFGSKLCQCSNRKDMPVLELIKSSNSCAFIFWWLGASYRWLGLRAHWEGIL